MEQPEMEHPLHQLYYIPNGRFYATGLDPSCSLAEVGLSRDQGGGPVFSGFDCLDTQGQMVGKGAPYIVSPHGISAFGDSMVVTSTVYPDLATGVGNVLTIIDLNTREPIENITVEKEKPLNFPSSPVEVLFARPDMHPDTEPAILANTMFGFETWKVPYDADSNTFGEAEVIYSGVANETAVPLEFYGAEDKLHISHALPIVVKGYELAALPELVSSGLDIVADPGAHHMIFFHLGLGP